MSDELAQSNNAPSSDASSSSGAPQGGDQNSPPSDANVMFGSDGENNAGQNSSESGSNDDNKPGPAGGDNEKSRFGDQDDNPNEGDQNDDGKDDNENSDDGKEAVNYDDVALPQNLPDGIEVDTKLLDTAKEVAAKHNLPKEALQDMVNLYAENIQGQPEKIREHWAEIESDWKKTAKSDKEIGGDNYQKKCDLAHIAAKRFSETVTGENGEQTNAFMDVLDQFRLGNHPEFIRVFSRIGEAISEEGAFPKGNNKGARTAADILFDNTKS